jgi:hypothetical protein
MTLAQIAHDYVELHKGRSKSPVKDLARKHRYSRDRMSVLVYTARERGLLTGSPKKGQAGGALTPRAIELLEAVEDGTQ